MDLKKKLFLAKKNRLSVKDTYDLILLMNNTKIAQKKCDIAVALSFIKNRPEIVEPIMQVIPFWQKSIYSGNSITTYSRLIVDYFDVYKFNKLLYSKNLVVRKIISRAFCFIVLTDGVDRRRAMNIYKKSKNILKKYLKFENNQKNKKFIHDFLQHY